ncbi:hypothetical protein ERO13_A01G125900v2 [Gossypium hirsutum]|uniref:Rhamnogalacturonan lyase domain-containing protein n=2 Tax=Gossypium TaxID=3633 RepID=A0A5J5WYC6_GOSBA|nr:hypothetical protein ES319_A01G128800v1 [Gossypium barbadense]KAG4214495.1 hypothetical protein ERO13_A01G125900v2 [Gossypium hirsutum]TYJ49391.1 hypothetical protein E1A91_A01G131500v1 [Gossypium mustelinum]
MPSQGVKLYVQDKHVVLDNGILQVTISNPDGILTAIQYNGIDNLLAVENQEADRGYWDLVWNLAGSKGTKGKFDRIEATSFEVIVENEDQVELSFTRTWNPSLEGKVVPLNIEKRFIMLRNSSGFYTYAIYEHLKEWPAFNLDRFRVAFKLRKDKFHYMAMADNRQRYMPLPDDRLPYRSQTLAYPEAVLLVDPMETEFRGEVDDKYQYSCENKDNRVHGWICNDPPVGFWQITPSDEFRSAGPHKQNLTSHVGPTTLAVMHSVHYSGEDLILKFGSNEAWKKVFGPIFIYLNSLSDAGGNPLSLWEDAKQQMRIEVQDWPYTFPASQDFPQSHQRGNVSGRLLVKDRYVCKDYIPANGAYVGLAPPGDVGSWQSEVKGMIYSWVILYMNRQEMALHCGKLESRIALLQNSTFLIRVRCLSTGYMLTILTDLGSMGYGKDMQIYILIEIWFTQLGLVTIQKTGFLLRSPERMMTTHIKELHGKSSSN